jgi:hypothetical protein
MVAMLIFAPGATDAVIGSALGGGPLRDRPADMLKVWPAEFNAMLDRLLPGIASNDEVYVCYQAPTHLLDFFAVWNLIFFEER